MVAPLEVMDVAVTFEITGAATGVWASVVNVKSPEIASLPVTFVLCTR
jgi:hypothetical protein